MVLVFYATAGHADFTGKVVGVIDGDTIDVLHDGVAKRIRLNGIMALRSVRHSDGRPRSLHQRRYLTLVRNQ